MSNLPINLEKPLAELIQSSGYSEDPQNPCNKLLSQANEKILIPDVDLGTTMLKCKESSANEFGSTDQTSSVSNDNAEPPMYQGNRMDIIEPKEPSCDGLSVPNLIQNSTNCTMVDSEIKAHSTVSCKNEMEISNIDETEVQLKNAEEFKNSTSMHIEPLAKKFKASHDSMGSIQVNEIKTHNDVVAGNSIEMSPVSETGTTPLTVATTENSTWIMKHVKENSQHSEQHLLVQSRSLGLSEMEENMKRRSGLVVLEAQNCDSVSEGMVTSDDILHDIKYDGTFPTVTERYLTPYYRCDVREPKDDICIRMHSNRICMITLAPSHLILQERKKITKVNFKVSAKLDRGSNTVTGKGKHGAQPLQPDSNICSIECLDGSIYPIKCGMTGKLVEVNDRLLDEPDLLHEAPHKGGYLAIALPNLKLIDEWKKNVLTQEDYEMTVMAREIMDTRRTSTVADGIGANIKSDGELQGGHSQSTDFSLETVAQNTNFHNWPLPATRIRSTTLKHTRKKRSVQQRAQNNSSLADAGQSAHFQQNIYKKTVISAESLNIRPTLMYEQLIDHSRDVKSAQQVSVVLDHPDVPKNSKVEEADSMSNLRIDMVRAVSGGTVVRKRKKWQPRRLKEKQESVGIMRNQVIVSAEQRARNSSDPHTSVLQNEANAANTIVQTMINEKSAKKKARRALRRVKQREKIMQAISVSAAISIPNLTPLMPEPSALQSHTEQHGSVAMAPNILSNCHGSLLEQVLSIAPVTVSSNLDSRPNILVTDIKGRGKYKRKRALKRQKEMFNVESVQQTAMNKDSQQSIDCGAHILKTKPLVASREVTITGHTKKRLRKRKHRDTVCDKESSKSASIDKVKGVIIFTSQAMQQPAANLGSSQSVTALDRTLQKKRTWPKRARQRRKLKEAIQRQATLIKGNVSVVEAAQQSEQTDTVAVIERKASHAAAIEPNRVSSIINGGEQRSYVKNGSVLELYKAVLGSFRSKEQ